jgi:hypothetical protein
VIIDYAEKNDVAEQALGNEIKNFKRIMIWDMTY